MFAPGDIISHTQLCAEESGMFQRGMNFSSRGKRSVILMSVRKNAPYADRIEEDGRVLIYEGHDQPKSARHPNPKALDQVRETVRGSVTENGRFFCAAKLHKDAGVPPERVRVYEKIMDGIWVYNGTFSLVDAWEEQSKGRKVFKFRLEITDEENTHPRHHELEHDRLIPSPVKLAVWKRDGGKCVTCGSTDNLHFDHIIPYSLGGSSLVAENIQLLCARHNLSKSDNIQ